VYLYHANLGWLLGHRGLLLTHRGRKSGWIYQTVLEVVRYDPATRESVAVSGWGERSDWYRNIKASPALEVRTGRDRYVPEQRFLIPEENQALISEYARRHPLTFRFLARAFGYPLRGTEAKRRKAAESLRLVAFRPKSRVDES
jgi:deazaflavin-dependent oxidoreductase (nitroreductase family)